MNTLDLVILIVLAAGIAHGFSTGLIRQVASVFGMLLSFLLALQLMQPVGQMAARSIGTSESVAPLIGFVLVFLVVQLGVMLVTRLIDKVVKELKLTGVNRVLGGGAGAFKAAIVLSVVFMVLVRFEVPSESARSASTLYAPVATVLPSSWDYLSELMPQLERISEKFGDRVEEEISNTGR